MLMLLVLIEPCLQACQRTDPDSVSVMRCLQRLSPACTAQQLLSSCATARKRSRLVRQQANSGISWMHLSQTGWCGRHLLLMPVCHPVPRHMSVHRNQMPHRSTAWGGPQTQLQPKQTHSLLCPTLHSLETAATSSQGDRHLMTWHKSARLLLMLNSAVTLLLLSLLWYGQTQLCRICWSRQN